MSKRRPPPQIPARAAPSFTTARGSRTLPGTTVDKKLAMAITGLVWAAFVLAHVLGNLLVFVGPAAINRYAALLEANREALFAARVVLYGALVVHVAVATDLTAIDLRARGSAYVRRDPQRATVASRTMRVGGAGILAFVVFHILHLTTGTIQPVPFREHDVYANVTGNFRVGWVAAIYLVAMAIVGLHVWHGTWAAFKSMGLAPLRARPFDRRVSWIFALLVWLGFSAIPVGVAAGAAR